MKNPKALAVSLLIPLTVGGLSGVLNMEAMKDYAGLDKPPLSPPGVVFPIVWGVLFLLMGISCYLVAVSRSPKRRSALTLYGVQLAVNFVWPFLFFSLKAYLFALIWLLLLWVLVLLMILKFRRIKPAAGWLQLPYLLWLTFAAYLNLGVYLLN